MVHVGDKVKIGFRGAAYSTYPGFLDYYREAASSTTAVERVCSQYVHGRSVTEAEAQNSVFTVMFVREHGALTGEKLALINDGNVSYIININALTLLSTDMPFTEGDKVYIIDSGPVYPVYSSWDRLIKHVSTVIPDGEEVRHKWIDGHSPTADDVGGKSPESIFTVKWIGRHVSRPDEDIVAIISNNNRTYIMSARGLAGAGEKSWDKYIIYVRNWAVVNKEAAQSVRDATGPKPYAEWLSNKS